MGKTRLANPHSFVQEAHSKNIRYEYLIEAVECIGLQNVSKMFKGRSKKSEGHTLSASSIQNWIETFEFHQKNPDVSDNEFSQSRLIEKNGTAWDQFVELIHRPISNDEIEKWKHLPNSRLGDEAVKHGMTLGIRNSKSIKSLLDRMLKMVDRRRPLWKDPVAPPSTVEPPRLSTMNMFQLRDLAHKSSIGINSNKTEIIHKLDQIKILRDAYDNALLEISDLKKKVNELMIENLRIRYRF